MSKSKGKLIVVVFVFVMLALLSLACGGASSVAAAVVPGPAQIKQETMDNARAQDASVFVFHGSREGLAICEGTKRLASLKEAGKEYFFEFTSQEALNLTLCSRNAETGNYSPVQNLGGASPGDYLSWDSNGTLSWTRYH